MFENLSSLSSLSLVHGPRARATYLNTVCVCTGKMSEKFKSASFTDLTNSYFPKMALKRDTIKMATFHSRRLRSLVRTNSESRNVYNILVCIYV